MRSKKPTPRAARLAVTPSRVESRTRPLVHLTGARSADLRTDETTTGHKIDMEGIDHPRHYNVHPSGIEAIQVIEHMTFNVGNAVKYCWRTGLKASETPVKDLKKALWYIQAEIDRLERGPVETTRTI